jgi:hypothetical protein
MATISQRIVPRTRIISIEAKTLFFKPNWIGVKATLKTIFSRKGIATIQGICFVATL